MPTNSVSIPRKGQWSDCSLTFAIFPTGFHHFPSLLVTTKDWEEARSISIRLRSHNLRAGWDTSRDLLHFKFSSYICPTRRLPPCSAYMQQFRFRSISSVRQGERAWGMERIREIPSFQSNYRCSKFPQPTQTSKESAQTSWIVDFFPVFEIGDPWFRQHTFACVSCLLLNFDC